MSNDIKLSPEHGLNPTIPVCFWCGQEKEEIALLGKIDKEDSEAPRKIILNYEPCDKCKEFFNRGIHVIGVTEEPIVETMFPIVDDGKVKLYPTGSMFVAPEDWVKDFLTANEKEGMIEEVLEKKTLLMPDALVSQIIDESNAPEMEVEVPEEVKAEDTVNEDN